MLQAEPAPRLDDYDDAVIARDELLDDAHASIESQLAATAVMLTALKRLPNASQRQKAELEQSRDKLSAYRDDEDSLLMMTRTMENADNLYVWLEDIVLEGIEHGTYTPDEVDALYDRLQLLDDALKDDLSPVLDKIDDAITEFFDTQDEEPDVAVVPEPVTIAAPTPQPPMVQRMPRPLRLVKPETPEELYTAPARDPALEALVEEISSSPKSSAKVLSANHRTMHRGKRRGHH